MNVKKDTFETLLPIGLGTEEKARELFDRIKSEFPKNEGEPEIVIDLLDEHFDIQDGFPVTFIQAATIAELLGHRSLPLDIEK